MIKEKLANAKDLREKYAKQAKARAFNLFTYEQFIQNVNDFFNSL